MKNMREKIRKLKWRPAVLKVKERINGVVRTHPRWVVLLGCVGAFIGVNILFSTLPLRADFSSGQAYTLSSSSKKVIREIDGTVAVDIFLSSDLPLRLLPLKTDIIDLSNEYVRVGGKRIRVRVYDPKKDTAAQKKAQEYGIPQLTFSQVENDRYAVSSSYIGIGMSYRDKKEVIPQAVNPQSLEYDITSAIHKMTRREVARVGLVGFGEMMNLSTDSFATMKKLLSQQFTLENIPVGTGAAAIDPEVKTIILTQNGTPYSPEVISQIKTHVEKGNNAIFMIDGVEVSDDLQTKETTHGLFSLLGEFGLSLQKNLVLSENAEIANFQTSQGTFFTPYPFWVKTDNTDKKRAEFGNVRALVFPWASSVRITGEKDTVVLARSLPNSWVQKGPFALLPDTIPPPKAGERGAVDFIVEKKLPEGGRITLIPTSRFVKDQFLSPRADNMNFMINLVNTYASGGALSSVRTRAAAGIPLSPVTDSQKDPIKYAMIFALPAFFVLGGAIRLWKRT